MTQSFDREIISNHYFRRLPWLHQTSHRDRVIIKVLLRYSNGVGWGVCIKIGICSSAWQIDTLGPLGDDCIYEACKRVTRSRECNVTGTSKTVCQKRDRTRYRDTKDWISDKPGIMLQREWDSTFTDQRWYSWSAQGSTWLSRSRCWSLIGEESRSCLECSRPVGWHT